METRGPGRLLLLQQGTAVTSTMNFIGFGVNLQGLCD